MAPARCSLRLQALDERGGWEEAGMCEVGTSVLSQPPRPESNSQGRRPWELHKAGLTPHLSRFPIQEHLKLPVPGLGHTPVVIPTEGA